jgi:hypothetical protein
MKLSILICHVYSRAKELGALIDSLLPQIGLHEIQTSENNHCQIKRYVGGVAEIVVMSDAGELRVGKKRNLLKGLATGDYFTFVDDDDTVSKNYVREIAGATDSGADVIVFDAIMYQDGKKKFDVKYGLEFGRDYNTDEIAFRLPNHLMAARRLKVMNLHFPERDVGEDSAWALRVSRVAKTQERINEVLYHYYFSPMTTLAQAKFFRPKWMS